MKRVLMTGAAGFVGRPLLDNLLRRGCQVRVICRAGQEEAFQGMDGIESVVLSDDLFAEPVSWWQRQCEGVDTVVHVAWFAVPGEYLHSAKNLDCLQGTLTLAKAAVLAGVRRWVGIGSCFEYDLSEGHLSTCSRLAPSSPYSAAKIAAYTMLSEYLACNQVEFAWCRLFYLHGEGENLKRLVPYIRQQLAAGQPALLSQGTQVRDYLDICEAARMIADIALRHDCGAFNICSGQSMTIRQLAEQIADEYGRRDLLIFGARHDNAVDPPVVIGVL